MAKTKKTNKSKKKPKAKQKVKLSWAKIISMLILLAIVSTVIMYFYVDNLVQTRIIVRKQDVFPGIYSRPFELYNGKKVSVNLLSKILQSRQYSLVTDRPKKAGEYFEQDGVFEIFLRDFYLPGTGNINSTIVLYDSNNGVVSHQTDLSKDSFSIEPVLLSPFGTQDIKAKNYQPLTKFPKHLQLMLLTAEDQRFYEHFGIDLKGILRALVTNISAGRIVQGGSTLTQQLAKNLILSPKRTLGRKILEAFSAISVESHYTKNEILELYMNEVYLGQEGSVAIHGFPEASQAFFRKNVENLSLAESALLVGIIRAPSYYSPRLNLKRAIKRKNIVLKQALTENFITKKVYQSALNEKIIISGTPKYKRSTPFFETTLTKALANTINEAGLTGLGARIYTGIDGLFQECGQTAVTNTLAEIEQERPGLKKISGAIEGGLVAIEPHSGLVRAYIGGRDYSKNQFDHITQALRPIGSTVKPFIYLNALDPTGNNYKVATATSIIRDAPYDVEQRGQPTWRPENYDLEYKGDISLRYALENSRNIPAVYVTMKVGVSHIADTLKRFGIVDNILPVPAIALGAVDSNLLKITSAYSALANGGIYVEPRFFLNIVDNSNDSIARSRIIERRVASESASYIVTNILQGVIERGTGTIIRKLGYNGFAGGKTGTSNDLRDSWFVGYSPDLAVGVWVGNDKNLATGLTGASGAGRVWANFMQCISPLLSNENFIPPPSVEYYDIDTLTGKRVSPDCPGSNVIKEVFIRGTEPDLLCKSGYRNTKRESVPANTGKEDSKKRTVGFWERLFGY